MVNDKDSSLFRRDSIADTRRQFAEQAVRQLRFALDLAVLDEPSRLSHCHDSVHSDIVPELAVDGLNVGVLDQLAGTDEYIRALGAVTCLQILRVVSNWNKVPSDSTTRRRRR